VKAVFFREVGVFVRRRRLIPVVGHLVGEVDDIARLSRVRTPVSVPMLLGNTALLP
jgi:hypothetical protein